MALFTIGSKAVSMKSGLEDRNNHSGFDPNTAPLVVSMKSGLEDRNNVGHGVL